MDNKKLAAIVLIMAVALSASGFIYAVWKDMVYIKGKASMGSLTIVWDEHEIDYLSYSDSEPSLPEPKDIASAKIYYDEASYHVDSHTGKGGYEILILEIYNAYPQYEVHFTTLVINNTGTIPAHMVRINIEGYDETDNEPLNFVWEIEYSSGGFWDNGDDDTWDTEDDVEIINVEIVNFICHQLDPCNKTKGEIDFRFKQEAEECHTYTFTVEIVAVQWNKVEEVTLQATSPVYSRAK